MREVSCAILSMVHEASRQYSTQWGLFQPFWLRTAFLIKFIKLVCLVRMILSKLFSFCYLTKCLTQIVIIDVH